MKRTLTALLLILISWATMAQTVVKDTANVKKPAYGKLYFQKSDTTLYLYAGGYKPIREAAMHGGSSEPKPTQTTQSELPIGYWELPDRILVAKAIAGQYYLMQTNPAGSYYVARGRNLLTDTRTKVSPTATVAVASIASSTSAIGGLAAPQNFPEAEFLKLGYTKNTQGEYVKPTVPISTPPVSNTPVSPTNKISIPVGAIMWDGWHYDYWADAHPRYDLLINHVSKSRLVATEWMDKFSVVPFYGQYHAPENIKIRYNVRWSQELGRNTYDEMERSVQVRYDKTQADCDREIQYYADAGFDFFCFNYYNSDSPLSEARLQFVASPNKRGIKMTFMLASQRSSEEINYITDLMQQDYWLKIDNKPVLYFNAKDMEDLPKYKAAYAAKGGGDIYVVYYSMGGYPGEFAEYQKYRASAGSSYTLFIGQGTADMLIKAEAEARNTWMGQYKNTQIGLIPVLSTGFENLHNRSSLDATQAQYVEKATLPQIEQKLELMKAFIKEHPEKVPAILWYAGNEILESGNPIVPTRRKDGTINTSMLDTISRHLN